eukprot:3324031-Pleurochrysis_carterae.AAC.2
MMTVSRTRVVVGYATQCDDGLESILVMDYDSNPPHYQYLSPFTDLGYSSSNNVLRFRVPVKGLVARSCAHTITHFEAFFYRWSQPSSQQPEKCPLEHIL